MTRSKIRENVFKMLFRAEFHDADDMKEQLDLFDEELENPSESELFYINSKSKGILEHIDEIDDLINEKSTGWKTSRMAKVDLSIIRIAVYEIKYEDDIPFKVSVNEAVELAKKYGADESPAFVNGILAKFA
ncbi:transcription antitermination factor NusB [Agathobacter sp.]|uniref:transcription antitermination factor NusB n=1 Tax=Agathobacter sp. TaxID=2021311 RepID=UPI003AB57C90